VNHKSDALLIKYDFDFNFDCVNCATVVYYTSKLASSFPLLSFVCILLRPVGERSIAISLSVCLSVRLSVREHISGTAGPIFTIFLCRSAVAVARSSSGGVAIRHVLPVLWMTSCLAVMGRMAISGVAILMSMNALFIKSLCVCIYNVYCAARRDATAADFVSVAYRSVACVYAVRGRSLAGTQRACDDVKSNHRALTSMSTSRRHRRSCFLLVAAII